VYAYDTDSRYHAAASAYWSDTLSNPSPVGIPIQCLHGFLRIITHPVLGNSAMPMSEAFDIVQEWLRLPQVRLLVPGDRHMSIFAEAIKDSRAVGGFVSDVAIAATVMEYGATLHTVDRGFARIPKLPWINPLQP
jgi:toxin-antitoxin system PIN domain toxin